MAKVLMAKQLSQYGNGKNSYIVRLKYDKETPGAVRFVELNDDGEPVTTDAAGATFPFLYLRKKALRSVLGSDLVPRGRTITITIS